MIAGYLAGIIALGVWLGRGQKSTRDYFSAAAIYRGGVWPSIVATETSALTFIGVPAMFAEGGNLGFIQIVFGYAIGRLILAVVMVPYYFKNEIYSPFALIGNALGYGAHKTAAGLFLIAGTTLACEQVRHVYPLQLMLGWDVTSAIFLFVGLSLVYTAIGGLKAVVWTDAVQLATILLAVVRIIYPHSHRWRLGGGDRYRTRRGQAGVVEYRVCAGRFVQYLDGHIRCDHLCVVHHGIDQLVAQRVLPAAHCRWPCWALIFSAVTILPMMMLFLFVGVMLSVAVPTHADGHRDSRKRLRQKTNRLRLPHLYHRGARGRKGLLLVGIFAAAMSS